MGFKGLKSLALKIVVSVAAVTIIGIGTLTYLQMQKNEALFLSNLEESTADLNSTILAALKNGMLKNDTEGVDKLVEQTGKIATIKQIFITDETGKITRTSGSNKGTMIDAALMKSTTASSAGVSKMATAGDGSPYVSSFSPIRAEKDCLTCHSQKEGEPLGYISVDAWAKRGYEQLSAARNMSLLLGLIIMLLMTVAIYFVAQSMAKPLVKLSDNARNIAMGDFEQNIGHHSVDEIGVLADSFRALRSYAKEAASAAEALGNGDLSVQVKPKSERDVLSLSLKHAIETQQKLAAETGKLSQAAIDGKLSIRGDSTQFNGCYRDLVQGINNTLDAVIGPLQVAANYVDRISKGDIPTRIADKYNGDFNEIKNNLNTCIDAVNMLVADAAMLSKAAVEGKLDTRADAAKHGGDFRKIVQGVNDTLDAVIGPLKVAANYVDRISKGDIPAKITDKYSGDFNEIKNNVNTCIDAVNLLVGDANMLANAAVEGRLQTRAEAAKHGGDFRRIVQGVNDTLDAVISPVNEAAEVLEKVAAKDLTARVKGDYRGDLAKLKNVLNQAVQNLDDALTQVMFGAEQVTSAATQISAGSQSLSQGASEQASSLEEVSSSLQEMSSMTKQNAANAKEARGLSDGARSSAEKGVESMKRLSEAIAKIKGSSDATAKIVKTIDEIAFQTNLLALNAAVEAARAGDAGKGFAVVAEEVRNLAMRSAEAAKNTANLIEESVKNAEGGVSINQEVLKQLVEINGQVNKVSEVMAEIAAASDQQSQGVTQVNTAVEQMNQVTQQTAANAEESASAAEELSGQSEEMKGMVATFRLSTVAAGSGHRGGTAKTTLRVQMPQRRLAVPRPGTAKPAPAAAWGPSPAKLIPLDDDEELILKEF